MKYRILFAAFAVVASLLLFGGDFIAPAMAQVDPGLSAVGETVALPDTDIKVIIARIINIFLGLLGIIFTLLILYAGFLWMTAGGDPSKVDKAKKYLTNSIIGLAIILMSWAIATFVINSIINATGGGGGGGAGGGGGGAGGTGGGFGPSGGDAFRIMAKSPQGTVGNADLIVRVLFNKNVDDTTLNALSLSPSANGSWTVDPDNEKRVIFTPSDPCPGVPQKMCFPFNTEYTVTVGTDLRSTANEQLRCGGFYPDCTFTFTSGDTVDIQGPNVEILSLYDGMSVPVDTAVEVLARATDDIGISSMEFTEGGQVFHSDGPTVSPSPKTFESSGYWDTVGKTLQQTYTINVSADDLDTNQGSTSVDVVVLSLHCFDDIQNEDETGKDCGGTDCLACPGGACTSNSQCASGLCVNGTCVEQPIITDVKPISGREGTYVSIWGNNFGDTGTVTFLGPPEAVANAPQACTALGTKTWTNNFVLVEVPAGASSGPLRLLNGNSQLEDRTDDTRGPLFNFELTNEEKPGLCGVNPDTGKPGDTATAQGSGLGSTTGQLGFGNFFVSPNSWSDAAVSFLAPVVNAGKYPVWVVHDNGAESNKVPYTIQTAGATQAPPVITYVDPTEGPRGEYISIVGQRFGSTPGIVKFVELATGDEYNGDAAFPNGCDIGWWRDNIITIKVPSVNASVPANSDFDVYIIRNDQVSSNEVDFVYSDGVAGPGICTINPTSGPIDTLVRIYGERLGSSASGNQVVFSNNLNADVVSWQSDQIEVRVPDQSVTGAVYARVSGVESNEMQFAVANCQTTPSICDAGQICCPNGTCSSGACAQVSFSALYSWQISTGVIPSAPSVVEYCDLSGQSTQLPSPTPWLNYGGGDQVCVNPGPRIGVLFDMPIDWPVASPSSLFKLKKCIGAGADPCDELEDVAITTPTILANQQPQVPYVSFEPTQLLATSTYYYVFVSRDVRSADLEFGTVMDEDTDCPEPGLGYCYRFRTRDSETPCEVGDIYVLPWEASVQGSESQDFEALPVTKNAVCNLMHCDNFNFNWSTDPDSKAWLNDPNSTLCKQTVTAGNQEAMNPPVSVRATEAVSQLFGVADLYIRFLTPRIIDRFPECHEACSNLFAWAQFNTSLWGGSGSAIENSIEIKDNTGHYKNVKVYQCANENCFEDEYVGELDVAVELLEDSLLQQYQNKESYKYSFAHIEPVQDLAAGTYYVVWINGGSDGITSRYGVRMDQTQQWKFRTRLENEACVPERVDVIPARVIEDQIGDRELFTAAVFTPPDTCHVLGQTLKQKTSFTWEFPEAGQNVAKFVIGDIDLGGTLPHGCSNNCTAAGSDGIFGATAICGNQIIETIDSAYCNGGVTPANQSCVLLPIESGAGEQCDDGPGGLCDDLTCLWKPVPGGQCGNNIVQYASGEMCDPGTRCWNVTSTQSQLEGLLCNVDVSEADCLAAEGTCGVQAYRGCSAGCKHLGASSVQGTTCGNGDIAAGEDCDLGANNGRGCSNNCLHTGSLATVQSICGNGQIEPGETCDGTPVPATCDAERCINLGTAICADPLDPDCCGNVTIDSGEDCDDGNHIGGDGCGANCLLEGSSWAYQQPSFCGNGILENGEVCEVQFSTEQQPKILGPTSGSGDSVIDPLSLTVIDPGEGTPDADNIIKTPLQCTYENVIGEAEYGVQCGKTDESQCNAGYGLDKNGCCARRPELSYKFPISDNNGLGWCRNVLIEAHFGHAGVDMPMDINSVVSNFVIAEEVAGAQDCPDGTEQLVMAKPVEPGLWNWVVAKWHSFLSWLKGEPAQAVYCTQMVSGNLVQRGSSNSQFVYQLDQALKADTNYIVRFIGDADFDDGVKEGIRTAAGVIAEADNGDDPNTAAWDLTWWFKTGADVCRINKVQIEDASSTRPGFFKQAFEEHLFNATALSVNNGQSQSISPTNDYNWQWQAWAVDNPNIIQNNDDPNTLYTDGLTLSQSAIRASNINGYAWVFARIKITVDNLTPGISTTEGQVVEGALPVTVFICDFPWPLPMPLANGGEAYAPFRDAGKAIVTNYMELWLKDLYTELYSDPNRLFFDFQTMYCRDRENSVMPLLYPHLIPLSDTDRANGILRQYLFTYNIPAYKADGIGIRVYKNLFHRTPAEWYTSQGFSGTPESLKIDGYEAVRDGATTYVGFPKTDGVNTNIYYNILVISHNIGASQITQDIYEQMLSNLAFNINFDFDNANVCVSGGQTGVSGGEIYIDPETNGPVYCTTDWHCLTVDSGTNEKLRCASFKYKLRHDMQRLIDFKTITGALDTYHNANQKYPDLKIGTFQNGYTNSRWPSWQETLGAAINLGMPIDPVNRFVTCGYCKPVANPQAASVIPCATDEDCEDEGWFCQSQEGFDSQTCWNVDERQFMCPYMDANGAQPQTQYDSFGDTEPYAPSRFYQYRALNGGRRFELGANFEVPPMSFTSVTGETLTEQWWYPPYSAEVKLCRTSEPLANGRLCKTNDDCKPCIDPTDPLCTASAPPGSCQPTGKRWLFKNVCNNEIFGTSAVCGDGAIGSYCSANSVNAGSSCTADADCAGGGTCVTELCELGQTKLLSCDYTVPGANDGFKLAVCQDCNQFADDPVLSICRQKVDCGNGRIDKTCGGGDTDPPCNTTADCDGVLQCIATEVCDDGVLNGTYGQCNITCTGIDKYCGDGQPNPGEDCDAGTDNGRWCANPAACYGAGTVSLANTCGFGCTGHAPYCGDAKTNGPEQCDGNVLTTASAICNAGDRKGQPCQIAQDCSTDPNQPVPVTSCGPGLLNQHPNYKTCEGITINRCATGAKICASPNTISLMENGQLFASLPTYKTLKCKTDNDCNTAAGEICADLSLAINCTSDAQCTIQDDAGICRAYATEHVRRCNTAGGPDQCKYQDWSNCKIAQGCGDGIVQKSLGEECDDGDGNAYHKACLPTCKKNICGDGFLHLNTEECDNGADNGTSVCQAQYGSTCNDCSTQCKIMATAGGYCGNDIKETGEQCDGNIKVVEKEYVPQEKFITPDEVVATSADAQAATPYIGATCEEEPCLIMKTNANQLTDLSCKQLGYDFALNDTLHRAIEIYDSTLANNYRLTGEVLNTILSNNLIDLVSDDAQNKLLNRIFVTCGLMDTESGIECVGNPCMQANVLKPYFKPQSEWPGKFDFWRCVNSQGLLNGFRMVGEPNDKPECGLDCKPTGCGRCSEESGDGTIHGYVLDRLWLQAVPTARVTLQYRGINVDQKLTNQDGYFEFTNLSARTECDQYRLVIDKYDDNACTDYETNRPNPGCLRDMTAVFDRDIDEGASGGYWPFTTEEFSIQSYPAQELFGMIFIYPRPPKGEGYVTYGRPTLFDRAAWDKAKECQQSGGAGCFFQNIRFNLPWFPQWAPHIIWPASKAYQDPWMQSGVGTWSYNNRFLSCTYKDRGTVAGSPGNVCTRDVNWVAQGNLNFNQAPYSAMMCPLFVWDRSGFDNCPIAGVNTCMANCIAGNAEWRLIKEWTGITPHNQFCTQYCNPTGSCPADPSQANILSIVQRCHLDIHNAQTSGYFRYKGQSGAEPNLTQPIEIYFAGPDYNSAAGESIFTYGQPSIPAGVLSWRNYWANTAIKIYVSTDKGIYTIEANDAPQTITDFKKPFWHLASISPTGIVTVQNQWQRSNEVSLPEVGVDYPDNPISVERNKHHSTQRPAGMACWNWYGARCQTYDTGPADSQRRLPQMSICTEQANNSTYGIVTFLPFYSPYWNPPFVDTCLPAIGLKQVTTDPVNYNQVNW